MAARNHAERYLLEMGVPTELVRRQARPDTGTPIRFDLREQRAPPRLEEHLALLPVRQEGRLLHEKRGRMELAAAADHPCQDGRQPADSLRGRMPYVGRGKRQLRPGLMERHGRQLRQGRSSRRMDRAGHRQRRVVHEESAAHEPEGRRQRYGGHRNDPGVLQRRQELDRPRPGRRNHPLHVVPLHRWQRAGPRRERLGHLRKPLRPRRHVGAQELGDRGNRRRRLLRQHRHRQRAGGIPGQGRLLRPHHHGRSTEVHLMRRQRRRLHDQRGWRPRNLPARRMAHQRPHDRQLAQVAARLRRDPARGIARREIRVLRLCEQQEMARRGRNDVHQHQGRAIPRDA